MEIVDLKVQSSAIREAAASLLVECFQSPGGWPNLDLAREELTEIISEGFARAMLHNTTLIGWVGGLPQYHGRVWELHPIVVHQDYRNRGIGRELVAHFEAEVSVRGALTATLGTDDETGMTSLSQVDLYNNLAGHLRDVRDLGREHPFVFYRKLGYAVTGVVPDANGRGRPDILMSKRIASLEDLRDSGIAIS